MPFQPFLATVAESSRLCPSFQRIRLSGLENMGPAGPILDLRIKLIIPGAAGLPEFPDAQNWWEAWQGLDPATRGYMRTYSVRDLDRTRGELTVDFVLHTAPGQAGPASSWASAAQPGDQIIVIAPEADDPSGPGIEFQPGASHQAHLYGDETALPAIARILSEWPVGLAGSVHIEVPQLGDIQPLAAPEGVRVAWHHRGQLPHGQLLFDALSRQVGLSPKRLPAELVPACETTRELVWETPTFSSSGEEVTGDSAPHDGKYWWIAGESSTVRRMRRLLVNEAGVPRSHVSFMGYWRRGASES